MLRIVSDQIIRSPIRLRAMWSINTTYVVFYYYMFAFRSRARQKLLAYYFTNPSARLHLRGLAAHLNLDPSNLSKELARLEREGLFQSEVSGRQKYFQLNRQYPLFSEVRKIVAKTIGATPLIAESLRKIPEIEEAYLYGSFARNQQDAASDIDVLVIGEPREEALARAVQKLERQLGREISYTVLTRKEFRSRRARKDAFLEEVWHNEPVLLISNHEEAEAAHRGLGADRALSRQRGQEARLGAQDSGLRRGGLSPTSLRGDA